MSLAVFCMKKDGGYLIKADLDTLFNKVEIDAFHISDSHFVARNMRRLIQKGEVIQVYEIGTIVKK